MYFISKNNWENDNSGNRLKNGSDAKLFPNKFEDVL